MKTYTWYYNGNSSGIWDDSDNWINSKGLHDGVPGAGDAADIFAAVDITVDDVTVADLDAYASTMLTGDLTVTGVLSAAILVGGDVTVGTDKGSTFEGDNLTAKTLIQTELETGTVKAGLLSEVDIEGATVSADRTGGLALSSGTLTAGTMTLRDSNGTFSLSGGTATISGAAKLRGGRAIITGGAVDFESGLTLSSGAIFNEGFGNATGGTTGGSITAKKLTVGQTGNSDLYLIAESSILTVTDDLVLGGGGSALLTIGSGAMLVVDGALDAAKAAHSTGTISIGDTGSAMTVRGEWLLGIAGTATATIHEGVSVAVGSGISLGVKAGGSGSLTVSDAETVLTVGKGEVTIGVAGTGTLTVENGALLDTAAGVEFAAEKGSIGKATLSGAGSTLKGKELAIGGTAEAAGGSGSLTIGAQTGADFAGATIWKTGTVDDSGTLAITGALDGDGVVDIESGGLLHLGGTDKLVDVAFTAGPNETLALASAKHFKAEITGFGKGDTIDLEGIGVTGKSFSHGILTLSNGTTLKFAGSHKLGGFHFAKNGQGTDITYQTPPSTQVADSFDLFGAANTVAHGSSLPAHPEPPFGSTTHQAMLGFR
jgi:T5SS/PEP-CTERM-associated repeat protein